MIENKEANNTKNAQVDFEQSHHLKNRLREDRRREPSEGFVYMSIVGWICRRETNRRKKDRSTVIFTAPGKRTFQGWSD